MRDCVPTWMEYYFPVHYKDKIYAVLDKCMKFYGEIPEQKVSQTFLLDAADEMDITKEQVLEYLNAARLQMHGKFELDADRSQFKKLKNKNFEIANLREHIEEKLQKMLRRNITRTKFAERFRNIIDEYNAGGSRNDDFYEKLLKLMEELRAEEERHIKEELSETDWDCLIF